LNSKEISIKEIPPEILDKINALGHNNWKLDLTAMSITQELLKNIIDKIIEDWKNSYLTELNLFSNKLTTLPPEIWKLTKLVKLDLQSNKIEKLPPEFWNLINLTYLDLFDNDLAALPVEFWKLTNLQSLDLQLNKLTILPIEIW
jgi:Leucine-rich repeat (LRR) protein